MKRHRSIYWLALLIVFALGLGHGVTAFAESAPPVISADPIIIQVGGSYDPLAGVTITDDVDSEEYLLERLAYKEGVNVYEPGLYYIYYFVADSDGNHAEYERPVFVLDPELPMIYGGYAGLQIGDPFVPLDNVIAWDLKDGDLSAAVETTWNDVDTSTPGDYSVGLTVTDSDGNTAEGVKYVYVDWPYEYYPTVIADDIVVLLGEEFDIMQGVTATDLTDGDLTASVEVEYSEVDPDRPGRYWTFYYVVNSLGLYGFDDRQVVVLDPAASPAIFVEDGWLESGQEFDPMDYAAAYDVEDGDITGSIEVVENTVDTSQAGEYYVIYRVADSDGNTTEVTAWFSVEWSYELYPQIRIENNPIYLSLNADFDPLALVGVTAWDPTDGDITDQIEVEDVYLDTSVPGEYYVTYSVTNSLGIQNWDQLRIYVLEDSNPRISAYDFSSSLNEELAFYMVDFYAYDLEDGNLRDAVTWDISGVDITQAGTYPVILMVYDSDGNYAETTCYVTIIDYSYPQLEVWDHTAYLDSEYDPLEYAYAWDQEDGELTDQIVVTKNTVKTWKLGTYYVTYSVTNSLGNTTTRTVTVEVIKEPVVVYYLMYQDHRILLEVDEYGDIAFITPDVDIPAGSEVGLAIYADDELVFDIGGIPTLNDVTSGIYYSIYLDDEGMRFTPMAPFLYQGIGFRYTALTGAVQFKATAAGMIYYGVGDAGTVPAIDMTREGIPGTAGTNTLDLTGPKPGKAQAVAILIEVPEAGISNTLVVELPKTPSGPVNDHKPDKPVGKPEDPMMNEVPAVPDPSSELKEKSLSKSAVTVEKVKEPKETKAAAPDKESAETKTKPEKTPKAEVKAPAEEPKIKEMKETKAPEKDSGETAREKPIAPDSKQKPDEPVKDKASKAVPVASNDKEVKEAQPLTEAPVMEMAIKDQEKLSDQKETKLLEKQPEPLIEQPMPLDLTQSDLDEKPEKVKDKAKSAEITIPADIDLPDAELKEGKDKD